MITVTEVTAKEDRDLDDRVMDCHDVSTGGHIRIRFYRWGRESEIITRAMEIATGHFKAKAQREAKALR